MNIWQRIILGCAAVALAVMIAYPPWFFDYRYDAPNYSRGGQNIQAQRFAGYYPLWEANTPSDQSLLASMFGVPYQQAALHSFTIRIDTARLSIQIVGLILGTIVLFVMLRGASNWFGKVKDLRDRMRDQTL